MEQLTKELTKDLFKPLPSWVISINVSPDGLAYGFNCLKRDYYLGDRGYWDFKPDFKGVRMSQYIGRGFEFLGEEDSVLEKY